MAKSSGLSHWYRPVLEAFAVSEERPDDVDAASGQGEDCLLVVLPFSPFPVIVDPRGRTVNGRPQAVACPHAQQQDCPPPTMLQSKSQAAYRRTMTS
jgi:hypothetical protein